LVIFDVPCLLRCNSTTNQEIETKSIALERSMSPLSNDILDVVVLLLQRKLLSFKKIVLRLDFDLQFSSFTLSGVSVNTVHYAGSNNPHTEKSISKDKKFCYS
jgi:hypothetical protein